MGLPAIKERYYSPAEYFELSAQVEHRMEFEMGVIRNMGTTSDVHSELMLNFASALKTVVKGRGCRNRLSRSLKKQIVLPT